MGVLVDALNRMKEFAEMIGVGWEEEWDKSSPDQVDALFYEDWPIRRRQRPDEE